MTQKTRPGDPGSGLQALAGFLALASGVALLVGIFTWSAGTILTAVLIAGIGVAVGLAGDRRAERAVGTVQHAGESSAVVLANVGPQPNCDILIASTQQSAAEHARELLPYRTGDLPLVTITDEIALRGRVWRTAYVAGFPDLRTRRAYEAGRVRNPNAEEVVL